MRLRPVVFCTALLLGVALAGCVDSSASSTPRTSLPSAPPPLVSEDTGSLTGLVTDEELRALVDAEIAVQGPSQASARTDVEGRFTLNDLQPGSYVVNALKLGYEQLAKRVEVAAGAAANVTLALKSVAIDSEPYVDSKIHDGMIAGPSFYCFCVIVLPGGGTIVLNLTKGAQEIVASMEWQVNQPTSTRYLSLSARHPDTGTAKEVNGSSGASPRVTRLLDMDIQKASYKAAMSYSVGFLCYGSTFTPQCLAGNPEALVPVIVYQQRVKLYSNVFYNQASPDGFTGLPG